VSNTTARRRLAKELLQLLKLEHPNILQVFGLAFIDGKPGIVTRWHQSGNVKDYLAGKGMEDRKRVVRQCAEGLRYLHQQKPIIKCSAIVVSKVIIDDNGNAMLGNVGFTQQLGVHSVGYTPYNQIMKLRNKPPEAYKAEPLSDRSEVWAFGCLAFEMITGETPYMELQNEAEIVSAILFGKLPATPEDLVGGVTKGDPIWKLLKECWASTPSKRPDMNKVVKKLDALST